jgi:nucleoid-associated protein YgaU
MEAREGSPSFAKSRCARDSVTALAAVAATAAATAAAAAEATTAAAAAAEAATAAAAAKAATRAVFLRTGFIDRQLTASELDAIDLLSRNLGLFSRTHGYEGKTAWAACHFVHGDVNVGNGTELAEMRAELVFSRFEREISNI